MEDMSLERTAGVLPTTAAPFTKFEHATVGSLYMLFCVIGVSSNLVTALTFYRDPRLVPGNKPWLHILLAMANAAVVFPSPLPASSSFSGRWLYGDTMCMMYGFEGMFSGIVAISSVIVLCIERYSISNSTKTGKTSCSYIWSAVFAIGNGFFWATMPLLGWSRYAIEHTGTSCALDWKNPDDSYVSYLIMLEIFAFSIPVMVALCCLWSAWSRTSAESTAEKSQSGSSGSPSGQDANQATPGGFTERQLQILCTIFLFFVLTGWGPFAFLCTKTMISGSEGLSMLAGTIPPLACKLMVSAYPLAYNVTSTRFRQGFLTALGLGEKKEE